MKQPLKFTSCGVHSVCVIWALSHRCYPPVMYYVHYLLYYKKKDMLVYIKKTKGKKKHLWPKQHASGVSWALSRCCHPPVVYYIDYDLYV